MPRRRKQGRRERNGRLQRDTQVETEWLAMEHTLRRRCGELGWKATVENMRKVRGHEGGTLWGKLYLLERIDRPMYEAACEFVSLREGWLASIAAPGMVCGSMEQGARGASLVAENVRRVLALRAAYLAADRALRASGVLATRAVHLALFEGEVTSEAQLQVGLGALAVHLNVADQRLDERKASA